MCIIASSAIGIPLPADETIDTMWAKNHDGAGLMYHKDGKVIIDKGYMKLSDFKAAIDRLKNEIDTVNTAVVLHFRIGTHGGNIPENTHPFPVVSKEPLLKKLHTSCDIGMAHNGIITNVKPRNSISDTMEYVLEYLAPLKAAVHKFNEQPVIQKLIGDTINGSRMCFLTPDGKITYVGNWTSDEKTGIMYSNSGYMDYDSYSRYWYDDDDNDNYINLPSSALMNFLSDAYIITESGDMIDADETECLIDRCGNVYYYNYRYDMAVRMENATAFNNSGQPVSFNEDEALCIEWVYEYEIQDN